MTDANTRHDNRQSSSTMQLTNTSSLSRGKQILRLYSYYSLMLALTLTLLHNLFMAQSLGNTAGTSLIQLGLALYVIFASLFVVLANRHPDPQMAVGYVFIEVVLLAILITISGGLDKSFFNLLLVPVIIANLLAPGVLGYGVAAWTTITVFYTRHYLLAELDTQHIVTSGIQGLLFFLLSAMTQWLSIRLDSALELASHQAHRIRRLQHFGRQALQELPLGVIACDHEHKVVLFNQTAGRWFSLRESNRLPSLLLNARNNEVLQTTQQSWMVQRVNMDSNESGDYLLYLEDTRHIAAEAQQIKLASLGRLSASIAHEIRNPLSALRQASHLLAEADYLEKPEEKLVNIIEQHCMRINRTVEDILQLSRRSQSCRQTLRLKPWLQHFSELFLSQHEDKTCDLNIHCDDDVLVLFDPDHLQQILHNLCANGLRHAQQLHDDKACLQLHVTSKQRKIMLSVTDNGAGVDEQQQAHLFEPFYTTEHMGTGLGLYLCRELCEANHATIHYDRRDGLTCFDLTLPKPAND